MYCANGVSVEFGSYSLTLQRMYPRDMAVRVDLEKVVSDKEIDPILQTLREKMEKSPGAPSVTLEQIESRIALECYTTGECFAVWSDRGQPKEEKIRLLNELELVTVCILVLQNGFKVTGESACVSRENFNAELGRKLAREDAVRKIWALEGYLLKEHEYAPAG